MAVRRSRGWFHGGGHGHLEHDTEKPNEGDMERPATTHANLQIRSVKVRH